MGMALQVLLLVVALVVAVAGIGVALALRMSARQRASRARRRQPAAAAPKPRTAAAAAPPSVRLAAVQRQAAVARPAVAVPPPATLTPEQAHQAKLVALKALLALGDARAERAAQSGQGHFADTQPAPDHPGLPSGDGADLAPPVSLLNLDQAPPRRRVGS